MQRVREQVQVPEQLHSGAGRVKSVTVAVLDTGIAYHPDLVGRLLAFSDFVEGRSFPYDDNGHGTHVCGIVCGSGELSGGRFRGMAPEAKLVVGKVLDRQGEGSCDSMQEALEWVLRVKNRYGIRVLNISVGAFFAKHTLIEPYDLNYRFSADFDWCIRIMKKARTLHNTHLTVIDYLDEGMTTRNQKASLKERFRIMCQHYGVMSTVAHHAWFIIRAISKK